MNSEDRALANILSGKENKKKIMVGYEGKKEKAKDIKSPLTDIMAKARMPWFCPKCDSIMKKRLDRKMWMLFDHCFECQLEEEHKMRVEGTFENYEKRKFFLNRRSAIDEQIESIQDWLKAGNSTFVEPVNIDTGFVHVEKYERPQELIDEANEALKQLAATKNEVNTILEELNG